MYALHPSQCWCLALSIWCLGLVFRMKGFVGQQDEPAAELFFGNSTTDDSLIDDGSVTLEPTTPLVPPATEPAVPDPVPAAEFFSSEEVLELAQACAPLLLFDECALKYPRPPNEVYLSEGGAESVPAEAAAAVTEGKVPTFFTHATCGHQLRVTYWVLLESRATICEEDEWERPAWTRVTVYIKRRRLTGVTFHQEGTDGGHYTRYARGGEGIDGYTRAGKQADGSKEHPLAFVSRYSGGTFHTPSGSASGSGGATCDTPPLFPSGSECCYWLDPHRPPLQEGVEVAEATAKDYERAGAVAMRTWDNLLPLDGPVLEGWGQLSRFDSLGPDFLGADMPTCALASCKGMAGVTGDEAGDGQGQGQGPGGCQTSRGCQATQCSSDVDCLDVDMASPYYMMCIFECDQSSPDSTTFYSPDFSVPRI